MKPFFALFKREFNSSFLSLSGALAAGLFILMAALFLWILPGEYHLPSNGYAEFGGFFRLLMNLLLFIVPVWTMRSFADEYRTGSWELLRSRPITLRTILWSKWLALWLGIVILLLLVMTNVALAAFLTHPVGNVDYRAALAAFVALATAATVFVAFGMVASFFVRHAVGGVFTAVALNALWVYGWDWMLMLPALTSSTLLPALSLTQQTRMLFEGVMDSRSILYMALVTLITVEIAALMGNRSRLRVSDASLTIVGTLLLVANHFFFLRVDLTEDGRYSLSRVSQTLLQTSDTPLRAHLFLDGPLNSGFQRLRQATIDLIDECNQQQGATIYYSIDNPFRMASEQSSEQLVQRMMTRGLNGINVNERDAEGALTQQRLFPYLLLTNQKDSVWVNLLNNDPKLSGTENLNNSLEEVEFKLMNALSALQSGGTDKIVFIEGHEEDDEPFITSALDNLSEYYAIDRGTLPLQPEALSDYKAMIIAAPKKPFSEPEKYIIDSFVQQGGSLFLLLDVAHFVPEQLYTQGSCSAIATNHNLHDLLFHYGIRVNAQLVLDAQCSTIPLKNDNGSDVIAAPWYFAPTLFAADANCITANTAPIRTEFVGTIDWVGTPQGQQRTVLYRTSAHSAHLSLPTTLSMAVTTLPPSAKQFNQPATPTVVLVEGYMPSPYHNRLSPIDGRPVSILNAQPARIVVAASGSLLRNEVEADSDGRLRIIPLGQERFSNRSYGNADVVANTMHYLCGKSELMQLRHRNVTLRLLDKQRTLAASFAIQCLSIAIPALLYSLLFGLFWVVRKRKFTA